MSTEINEINKINKINELYDKLTYFDKYGTSVILCIILTIIIFIIHSYFVVLSQMQPIKDNWINERCKPQNIPFAGLINKPNDKTATEYTQENFNYCVQDTLTGIASHAFQPLTYITNIIAVSYGNISTDIQNSRNMFSELRKKLKKLTEEIMGRILNITIPIQQVIIAFRDMASKIEGTLTSALFTSLGMYYTLKSLLGAIVEFIIIILITLAILIVILWILPFSWGIAGTMTAVFIAVSIPLAIMVIFLSSILDIHSSGLPSVPSMKHCFDEDTIFQMENGKEKTIKNINIGEKLLDGNEITCKIILSSSYSKMYNLFGIIVSDSHIIYYKDKWIPIKEHPEAKLIHNYNKPFIYCLNTSSKKIKIKNCIFTDWDELYGTQLKSFQKYLRIYKENDNINIHKYLHSGLSPQTLITLKDGTNTLITNIKIGDILWNNISVVGIVEMNGVNINKQYEYNLGKTRISCSNNLFCDKYINQSSEIIKEPKLYHLLTTHSYFYINNIKMYDYNICIDFFL